MSYRNIIVVDDFYENPDEVRETALTTEYSTTDSDHFTRSSSFLNLSFIPLFEKIINAKIKRDDNWILKREVQLPIINNSTYYNGTFYKHSPKAKYYPDHIHHDTTDYVGVVMLSPDCPSEFGTSFWEEKNTQKSFTSEKYSAGQPSDPIVVNCSLSDWREVERVDYKYNRLLLYSGRLFHTINMTTEHERINQLFSFNIL